MIVRRRFKLSHVWIFAWFNLVRTGLLAGLVWAAYEYLEWEWVAIPFLPVATVGTAVAFYVGFKNNSSYDRLWEARKIWGAIVNTTRAWATETLAVVGRPQVDVDPAEIEAQTQVLVRRQLAWINVLRLQLRRRSALNGVEDGAPGLRVMDQTFGPPPRFEDALEQVLADYVPDRERAAVAAGQNIAAEVLRQNVEHLTELKRRGWIDDFEHSDLKKHPLECLGHQGAAERIKSFPFPRQYANFSLIFVNLFTFLLPFGLIDQVNDVHPGSTWLIVPFSMLISWVFYSMEQVGDASENPFEGGVNDVPMSAMCRNLEIELLTMLGETDLPERIEPVDGLLL